MQKSSQAPDRKVASLAVVWLKSGRRDADNLSAIAVAAL